MTEHHSYQDSTWLYKPNFALAIVFTILYIIPTAVQFWQTCIKYESWYFIVIFLGGCLEVGGYILRAVSVKNIFSIPPYATQASLIILAPLFVGVGNYLLISRLCIKVLPSAITHIHRIPVRSLTKIFVLCDIVLFLIQVSGTSIAGSVNWQGHMLTVGTNVLIMGLATQVATFAFFMAIVRRFHLITREGAVKPEAGDGWGRVLKAVYISSVLIIIRSIYRLVDFSMGIWGYPFTHEWIFYVFESAPMLPAISIFCLWHPAEYFGGGVKGEKIEDTSVKTSNEAVV